MKNPFAGRSFLATLGMLLLAIASLFGIDTLLERSELAETRIQAADLFRHGQDLMQHGENAEAVQVLKDALAIERGNRDYRRTLAEAQLAAGKPADAEATLSDLLQSDSTDGAVNLIMARVLLKMGRFDDAVSYLHRAIYGRWYKDADGNRLKVRFELVDLLAGRNLKEQLLAELLPLEDEAPVDLKTRLRMGRLFLQAGSPARAADVYRGVVRDAPEEDSSARAEAYYGLGDADFAGGNYRTAQRNYQTALRLSPDEPLARQRLALCNELLQLDPTIRGIGAQERLRRSQELVRRTADETGRCLGQSPPDQWPALAEAANKALSNRLRPAREDEYAEADLDLAEHIWQLRKERCQSPPAADSAVALAMARLAQ